MFSRLLVIAFLGTLPFYSLFAQSDTTNCNLIVSGTVRDDKTGEPLAFANVYIPEQERGAISDTTGYYEITNLCSGKLTLRVSHLGCAPMQREITLQGASIQNFALDHSSYELNAVNISGEINRQQLNRISIKPALMARESGKSLGELVRNIPGATSIRTGSGISKPVFHGLHSNRLLILNNGIRQEGQQWGGEHAPEIDPFLTENISFVSGVQTLQFASDAMGGVLLADKAAALQRPGLNGKININGFSNNGEGNLALLLNGMVSEDFPLTYQLQGSLKKAGNGKTPDFYLENTGFEEYNYSYSLGWKKEKYGLEIFYSNFNQKLGIYQNSHIGNLTDLYAAINSQNIPEADSFTYYIGRPFQQNGHELFKINAHLKTGDVGRFNLSLSRQYNRREEYDVHLGYNALAESNIPQLDYRLTTHIADLNWEQNSGADFKTILGASVHQRQNTTNGRDFLPNYKIHSGGAYAIETFSKNKWELKAGLRYDYYEYRVYFPDSIRKFAFGNIAAGFSTNYKISNALSLLADVSTLWRPPAINEQFSNGIHHGTAAIENGDPDMNSERIYAASVAMDYQKEGFSAYLKGYHYHIHDFIYLDPSDFELTISGAYPTFNYRQADARFLGADFQLENEFRNEYRVGLKAALIYVSNIEEDNYFTMMPAQQMAMEVEKSFADFSFMIRPFFNVNSSYTFRQYRAPQVLPVSVENNIVRITEIPESFDFAAAPEGYFLLNAQLGFDFMLGRQQAKFSLVAENILNNTYRDYLNRMRYYADEPGFNLSLKLQIPIHFY